MSEQIPERMKKILQEVSRSFYITLRVLPGKVRPQIGLAYLLARTADTIADIRLVSADRRLAALLSLRAAIRAAADNPDQAQDFGESAIAQEIAAGGMTQAEKDLLRSIAPILEWLRRQSAEDRALMRDVLETISSGQEMDLVRFGAPADNSIAALTDDTELEQYIYSVAGCVGEFWTRMCRMHLFPAAALNDEWLLKHAVRFGKGLQLVNILRDLPADLKNGRCYLPRLSLAELGLEPEDLLCPLTINRLRPLLDVYIARAEADLTAGWDYVLALPWRHARIRLACAWPILIGIKTLARLRAENVLDAQRPLKIRRSEVRALIWSSLILYPSAAAWRYLLRMATK